MAIIVNDNPKTVGEAVDEIARRRDNHREWVTLNSEEHGDTIRPAKGVSANALRTSLDMARAYDNALTLLRACGAAP
jgi:hypothetical protein